MKKLKGLALKALAAVVLLSSAGFTTAFAAVNNTGKYVQIKKDTQLIANLTSKSVDERYAVYGKKYKILQDLSGYYKIKIGKVNGYIPKGNTTLLKTAPKDKTVLAWDYIYAASSNKSHYDSSSDMIRRNSVNYGIDAISPTWFDMSGDAANPVLVDKGDREYVKAAHRNGYEVWPRFAEMNKARAAILFSNSTIRTKVINDVVSKALSYNVDGINIDFEALGSVNKDSFTSFTKDLTDKLKSYGIKVSVDVTKQVPGSDLYSACYDRAALAKYADYVVLMGYDQNTASSAGPGGSYDWVEDGIKKIIASGVPKEKLILAVPFYMRDYTINDTNTQNAVFKTSGVVYKTPRDIENNKLSDIKKGDVLRIIGKYEDDWTVVEYGNETGYVKNSNIISQEANTPYNPSSSNAEILFSEDYIIAKEDTSLYRSNNEVDTEKIGDVKAGNPIKYLGKTDDGTWYIVEYNGANAYLPTVKGDYLPSNTPISSVNSNNKIVLTYDAAVIQKDCTLYSSPVEIDDNVLETAAANDCFKIISTTGDFYKVTTNSGEGYVLITDVTVSKTTSKVIAAPAISISTAASRISQYKAKPVYDSKLKQYIVQYSSNGLKHIIYVEDKTTMNWRADLINKYGLGGMGIWQLSFTPTDDIWGIIRSKMD